MYLAINQGVLQQTKGFTSNITAQSVKKASISGELFGQLCKVGGPCKISSVDISRYVIDLTRLRVIQFKFKLKLALTDLWRYLLITIKFVLG